jgi:PIN domain nuclease of toxin-antitoxin system
VLSGDLSKREYELVSAEALAISPIVLWEMAKLIQFRRLKLDMESPEFLEFLRSLTIFPITLQIAIASTRLDFKSDPADEIIAATSVIEKVPLLTRDRRLLRSRVVPLAASER